MKRKPTPTPRHPWQTGDFDRYANFQFVLPYQFLLLCKLMEVTPRQVLADVMELLSCGNWKRDEHETAKQKLIEYFIEMGYGAHRFSATSRRIIFKELDAISAVWPDNGDKKLTDLSLQWRSQYQDYWFEKWNRSRGVL